MFMVSETEAAAIRRAYEEHGEFAAAVELRRYFPGIADNANARQCARTIASCAPLPPLSVRCASKKRCAPRGGVWRVGGSPPRIRCAALMSSAPPKSGDDCAR